MREMIEARMTPSRSKSYDHAEDRPGTCPHCNATVVIPGSPNHGLADGDDIRPERLAMRCPRCAGSIWLVDFSGDDESGCGNSRG
jgi:hypothetical protein